jgi:hypothetical protein
LANQVQPQNDSQMQPIFHNQGETIWSDFLIQGSKNLSDAA